MASLIRYFGLVVLLSATLFQSSILWNLVGRADIDKTRLVKWSGSNPLNNGKCKVIQDANACEDVKIHYASNTAFLACGDPIERTHWYPCAGVRHPERRSEASFQEQLFKYDIKSGKTTELVLKGFDGDFITHGIDVYSFPDDPLKVGLEFNWPYR